MTARLFSHRPYWAKRFGIAPFLPTSRAEMDELGWDCCDIVIVTGDAYVDHPSFGMALVGRLLEAHGFRVGIVSQPRWDSADDFRELGEPTLFFGITGGNMDSMVNRYTSDRKIRSDDAYSPDGVAGLRPDRCTLVYSQRAREAFPHVPIVLGGIEASLRRIAHYDYWSDKIRRSVLIDAKADLLLYGNAERAIVELAHRLAAGEPIDSITDLRGTAFICQTIPPNYTTLDSTAIDKPGPVAPHQNPYEYPETHQEKLAEMTGVAGVQMNGELAATTPEKRATELAQTAPQMPPITGTKVQFIPRQALKTPRHLQVIRLPSYEQVKDDPILYAHASRLLHLESNPHNARALVQRHGHRELWVNPPPIPLDTAEMDRVYELPYARVPHPKYGGANIPAYEMIRFSVTIMRGCFGGCTFCSITEHEGRIIQNRSEDSIIREIEQIRDQTPGFTGVISDLGGPTANMYRLHCESSDIESSCRRLSCVHPDICKHLDTDHAPLIKLYRRARAVKGVKKILIASGLRYDLAVQSPEYVKELVTHHVGGYLKIAPEHTESGPLDLMKKPGMGHYDRFKELFDKYSKEAGKEQYLIPYFIAAHPGTTDEDMLNLALWLKQNNFRADQVQAFLPSPMALATAMYHSERNPLKPVKRDGDTVFSARGLTRRRLHKAFLRYHDPKNWPLLREALTAMGRADLIGSGKHQLIPRFQPGDAPRPFPFANQGVKPQRFTTQHVRPAGKTGPKRPPR